MAMVSASSQQTWVMPAGPEGTGSIRQGLVMGWGCQFWKPLLPEEETQSGVPLFQSGVPVSTLAERQSSAWVLHPGA